MNLSNIDSHRILAFHGVSNVICISLSPQAVVECSLSWRGSTSRLVLSWTPQLGVCLIFVCWLFYFYTVGRKPGLHYCGHFILVCKLFYFYTVGIKTGLHYCDVFLRGLLGLVLHSHTCNVRTLPTLVFDMRTA